MMCSKKALMGTGGFDWEFACGFACGFDWGLDWGFKPGAVTQGL